MDNKDLPKEEEKKEETKKRSKKHADTKLAINGTLDEVLKASFLGKPKDNKPNQ